MTAPAWWIAAVLLVAWGATWLAAAYEDHQERKWADECPECRHEPLSRLDRADRP